MDQHLPFDHVHEPDKASVPPQPSAASLVGRLALRLSAWHKRTRYARNFRGLDDRQLRDLGLNSLDQW
jgi:uncharacterized protein YjiS (DUF1127 family)